MSTFILPSGSNCCCTYEYDLFTLRALAAAATEGGGGRGAFIKPTSKEGGSFSFAASVTPPCVKREEGGGLLGHRTVSRNKNLVGAERTFVRGTRDVIGGKSVTMWENIVSYWRLVLVFFYR